MRKILITLVLLIPLTVTAEPLNCIVIEDTKIQQACIVKSVQLRKQEVARLEKMILASPKISQKDKRMLSKDQKEWEATVSNICNNDQYCLNSEMEQRVNDLSAYYAVSISQK